MDLQPPLNNLTPSSSTTTVIAQSTNSPPSLSTHPPPTNEEIDAVIQQATSSVSSDGRHIPLKDTRTQLFVGNLPYRVRWQDLKDLFRKAGTVLRADVSLGPDNRSRGYGTVLLATAEDAGRAVDMFNGYSWQSRILEVRLDRLPNDFESFSSSASGYHPSALISSHAPIIPGLRPPSTFAAPLPLSVNSLSSFVPQISLSSTLDESYADHSVFGHDRPTTAGGVSRNLFVGNLPFHCQWQDLKDLFRQAGTILRADVALGQDGRSRGFGTVVFATEHDAERAVNMFNGYEYNGRPLKVHYDRFMPSVGQSLTAPSSPILHSPFPGVNTASLASIASVTIRPTSSRGTPLPPPQPSHLLDYHVYSLNQIRSNRSHLPLSVLPPLQRIHPQAGLSRLGAAPEQQFFAHHSADTGLNDSMNINTSLHRNESPSIGLGDLPTPPSSSAGVPSVKGSRVSSPPLQLPQPMHPLSHPLLEHQIPPRSQPQPHAPVPLSLPTSSVQAQPRHSGQMPSSSSQRGTPPLLDQPSPPSRQRAHTHPAHPGPISLPPPSAFVIPPSHNFSPMSPGFTPGVHISPLHQPGVPPFPSPRAHPHSPFHHPMYSHARSPLHHPAHGHPLNATPSGLPPITPSMPSFQFAPGPPSLPHPSHPSIVFSPASTMSPGAFWGRPGGNPLSNAAPGAPVTKSKGGDEFDYFAGASAAADEGESYFPQLPQGGSNLAKEILRNEREGISGSGKKPAASGSATEDDVSQEVSTSSVSSGQSSTKERISSTGINGIIERLQSNVHVSLPRTIPRKEEQDRRILSPFGAPPPTRRTGSDPVQGQGQSSSRGGIERRASSAEIVHAADSEQLSGPMHVKIGLRPSE